MSVVPPSKSGKIDFYSDHAAVWAAAATTIGITTSDATALSALLATAVAKQNAQTAAYQAAKASTIDYDDAVKALAVKGSALLKKIKATAAASATPGAIYSAAQIPQPALPSPVAAPGAPFELKVILNPDGSLTLGWKCTNPAGSVGTIYDVRRKDAGQTAFVSLGATGARSFTDATVLAGTPSAVYEITAVRSTARGPSVPFLVNFGVSGAGETFATVAPPSPAAKLAA